ncbi:HNH endonuclease [Cecembia sp.]
MKCVYCGTPATQVHHKRYAKRNIGKEPIKWLVSICKTCHDKKH